MSKYSCYEVIGELDSAIKSVLEPGQDYYVLGGIASGAIRHTSTKFDHENGLIYPTMHSSEPVIRDNGTLRDIDILIRAVLDDEEAKNIVETVTEAIDDNLEVSVFGLDEHEVTINGLSKIKHNLADWISRRTIDEYGVIRCELYPLSQELPAESFVPYDMALPTQADTTISILNPAGHTLAYGMRSISGLRHKDKKKVAEMNEVVFGDPILKEQILYGPFRPWLDFCGNINGIGTGVIDVGDEYLRDETTSFDLANFARKARALQYLESKENLIEFAQTGFGAKVLSLFTHTR